MDKDLEFSKDLNTFKTYAEPVHNMVGELYDQTPLQVVAIIFNDLKERLVHCNKNWYYCNKGVWEIIKNPTNIIIGQVYVSKENKRDTIDDIIEKIKTRMLEQCKERQETYEKEINKMDKYNSLLEKAFKKIDTSGFTSQMTNHLSNLLNDNYFLNKLDINKYEMVFKNGILNLKNGSFRENIEPKDYVSKCIMMDYKQSSKDEINVIKNMFFKIGNADNEHADYYSSVLGYSLLGDAVLEKAFWCLVGQKGDNGKTTILDALSSIMPDYCVKVSNKAFYENVSNRHKYLAKIKGARIVYVEENIDGNSLDASFLKEIADGRRMNYEILYGTTETMEITGKVFIVSNNTPIFKTDGGLKNRYRQCQFESHFGSNNTEDNYITKEFIQDKKLLTKLEKQLAMPLINYLLHYSIDYVKNGLKKIPKKWEDITKETLNDNDKLSNFVEENFMLNLTDDDRINKDDIENLIRNNGITLNQFRDEMRNRGIEYDKTRRKNNKKGVWLKISLKDNTKD